MWSPYDEKSFDMSLLTVDSVWLISDMALSSSAFSVMSFTVSSPSLNLQPHRQRAGQIACTPAALYT